MRQVKRLAVGLVCAGLLLFAPEVMLVAHSWGRIYGRVEEVPVRGYGVVFGAYVFEDERLSDAARERVEAGVLLYRGGRVRRLYISGDNRSNRQAEVMAAYAVGRGVAEGDVEVDVLGIDTQDTCRHFAEVGREGVLVTQGYHLPRAMYICEREGLEVVGLAVDRLGILERRGDSVVAIWGTRVRRWVREAVLMWAYVLGIYGRVSDEAEKMERGGGGGSGEGRGDCLASPNTRLEPTALSWRFARWVEPAAVVISGDTLPESGGGSRAGR